MTRLQFLLCGLVPPGAAAAADKDHFVGVWTLKSCERRHQDGAVSYPYGEKAIGRLTYDARGRMSAQLMNPGREPFSREDRREMPAEDLKRAYLGYQAYYGTYDVDEKSATVIHHVESALIPNWVGTDLKRAYEFSGDKLILTAPQPDGSRIRLVWQRAGK